MPPLASILELRVTLVGVRSIMRRLTPVVRVAGSTGLSFQFSCSCRFSLLLFAVFLESRGLPQHLFLPVPVTGTPVVFVLYHLVVPPWHSCGLRITHPPVSTGSSSYQTDGFVSTVGSYSGSLLLCWLAHLNVASLYCSRGTLLHSLLGGTSSQTVNHILHRCLPVYQAY
jgi:hypothetical protein